MKRVLSRIAHMRRPVEGQAPTQRNGGTQESQLSHEHRDALIPEPQPELPQEDIKPPISRLPNEILADIFMLVLDSHLKKGPFFITGVCCHWREVAIGASLLWAKPRTSNYECVKLMLERSHPADLDIVLTSSMPLRTVQALVNCMWRVASLDLRQDNVDEGFDSHRGHESMFASMNSLARRPFKQQLQLVHIILDRVTEPARRLKIIRVAGAWGATNRPDMIALMQRLQPNMGQLRQLSFDTAHFDWSMFPLHNLVRLHLRDISVPDRISIQRFIAILGQMPSLESISFIFILDEQVVDSNIESTPFQPLTTTFPALQTLQLLGSSDLITYFLAHTAAPRLRRMYLRLDFRERFNRHANNYLRVVRTLATTVKTGKFGIFNTFKLGSYSFEFTLPEDPHASQGMTFHADIESHIRSTFAIDIGSRDHELQTEGLAACTQLIEDLIGLLGTLMPARIVNMILPHGTSVADFEQLLSMSWCSTIEKMIIAHAELDIVPALTRLLSVTLRHNVKDGESLFDAPFPDLKTISFKGGVLLKTVEPEVWEAMCDCLALRRVAGFPLEEFSLGYCRVTDEQYFSLEKAVTICTIESW